MRVGCPIRISTDQRLLAAPRGFSQRATSFIASWCQGIHRMPFSYSIRCRRNLVRRPPCTETIVRLLRQRSRHLSSAQKQVPTDSNHRCRALRDNNDPIRGSRSHTPLNTRHPTLGRTPSLAAFPVRHAIGQRGGLLHHTRPETHQNHIHPDKDHAVRLTPQRPTRGLRHANGNNRPPGTFAPRQPISPNSLVP